MTQVGQNRRRVLSNSSGILNGFNLRNMMVENYMLVNRFLYRIRRDISADFHLLDWKFLETSEDIEDSGECAEYADLHMVIYDCKSLKYNRKKLCVGININVIGRANAMDIIEVEGIRHYINKKVTIYLATRRNIEVDNCDGFIFDHVKFNYRRSDNDAKHYRRLASSSINSGYTTYGHINYDKLKEKT